MSGVGQPDHSAEHVCGRRSRASCADVATGRGRDHDHREHGARSRAGVVSPQGSPGLTLVSAPSGHVSKYTHRPGMQLSQQVRGHGPGTREIGPDAASQV
jgi:hypothetical protein